MDEMGNTNKERLKELKKELDLTYKAMREILAKNNVPRKRLSELPKEEYIKWNDLNSKSTELINEFVSLVRDNID